jgi:hypothetical protein
MFTLKSRRKGVLLYTYRKNAMRETRKAPVRALSETFEAFDRCVGMVEKQSGRNQWDLCLPEKSWFVK